MELNNHNPYRNVNNNDKKVGNLISQQDEQHRLQQLN